MRHSVKNEAAALYHFIRALQFTERKQNVYTIKSHMPCKCRGARPHYFSTSDSDTGALHCTTSDEVTAVTMLDDTCQIKNTSTAVRQLHATTV